MIAPVVFALGENTNRGAPALAGTADAGAAGPTSLEVNNSRMEHSVMSDKVHEQ